MYCFQTDVETVRRGGAESLAKTQRELGSQLSELRAAVGGLEMTNSSVREELAQSRKQEALLKAKMAEIGTIAMYMYVHVEQYS